jgi:hypothetical protein
MAAVASAFEDSSHTIHISPFVDFLAKQSDGSWSAMDVEGGPGTAIVTEDLIRKITRATPLQKTVIGTNPKGCTSDEPQ